MEEKKYIKLGLFQAILIVLMFISILCFILIIYLNKNNNLKNKKIADFTYINTKQIQNDNIEKKDSKEINVVASLEDEITNNSVWCGTLQLVWNDMINNVVKQDIIFTHQSKTVENLNRQLFTEKQISEKDYYKVYDLLTQDLKKKIKKSIKSKFNEKSAILDTIDWSKVPKSNSSYTNSLKKYLFYAMLKKNFKFKNKFDELDSASFGTKYNNIEYFGIDEDSKEKLYSQVNVLYYNSEKDFAIILNTKEGEQVILSRGAKGNTFATIYNYIVKETNNYSGNKNFTENDYLKVPNLKFNVTESFDELCNINFYSKDGDICNIEQILQTIEVEMDRAGGRIKSEAVFFLAKGVEAMDPTIQLRYFYLNDEFTIFLKESDKDIPYFASNIENITLFQK